MDVVKTRLQLQGELGGAGSQAYRGVGHALLRIGSTEGIRGLQRGLSAAYLLQFSNVSCRFGCYDLLKRAIGAQPTQSATGFATLMTLGAASGALAAVVSNPFFLLKTRFQAVGSESARHQHAYTNLREAFLEIGHKEGFQGYYRGLSVFVPRTATASAVQLSTYDVVKHSYMRWTGAGNTGWTHFASSLLTSVAVVLAMQPFDFAAVRLMNQPPGDAALYRGPLDCIAKVVQSEGILGVYKGTVAAYLRFGPYCVLTFIFLELFRKEWDSAFGIQRARPAPEPAPAAPFSGKPAAAQRDPDQGGNLREELDRTQQKLAETTERLESLIATLREKQALAKEVEQLGSALAAREAAAVEYGGPVAPRDWKGKEEDLQLRLELEQESERLRQAAQERKETLKEW